MARNTAHGKKVPIYKTWWFWVIIALFIYGFISGMAGNDEDESEESTQSEESSSIKDIESEAFEEDGFETRLLKEISGIL